MDTHEADGREPVLIPPSFESDLVRLGGLLDQSPMAVHVKDRDGRYLLVNQRSRAMLRDLLRAINGEQSFAGSDEELFGHRTDFDLFPFEVARMMRDHDLTVLESGQTMEFEEVTPLPDGDRIWMCVKFPIAGSDGESAAVGTIAMDVTGLQQRIQWSEERFRTAFDGAPIGIALLDNAHCFKQVNAALCELLGYTPAELMMHRYDDLVCGPRRGRSRRATSFGDDERVAGDTCLYRKDGQVVEALVTTRQLFDGAGAPAQRIVQIVDLTARKLAERALAESERRFDVAIGNSASGFAVIDPSGRVVQVNPALTHLLATREDALVGRSLRELAASEDVGAVDEAFARACQQGAAACEIRLMRPEGGPVWANTMLALARDEVGEPQYVMAQFHDCTERHREQAARQDLEEQLRSSQRLEAVGRLAGGVAHDFNNLLAVIASFADFAAKRTADDPVTHGFIENIRSATQRAAGLTKQLLIVGRKDAAAPEPLDLNAAIREMLGLLDGTLSRVQVVTSLQPGLWSVWLARSHADQVVMNLVVNARDAMPEGGTLKVETCTVELDERAARRVGRPPGPYVKLVVADTGTGIAPEVAAHVFEPFFTTKDGKGTGLGLAIVYGIVSEAGGDVRVKTRQGRGTRFEVLLPAKEAVVEETPIGVQRRRGAGERILLVDDEPLLRQVSEQVLRENGYRVTAACDGAEALERIEQDGPPDAVITDIMMPRLNGKELVRRLKARWPDLPIVMVSGYTEDGLASRKGLGRVTFVEKPFDARTLLAALRSVLESSG